MTRLPLAANAATRVYRNAGNPALVDLVGREARVLLDVGCGAGDNAALLRVQDASRTIYGITASPSEAALAEQHMQACWIADLELGLPRQAQACVYDAILFSHVLEHLRDPATLVNQAARCLRPGGVCVIAVPNVMVWRQRVRFMLGRFEYEDAGIMDETHLRFFSYHTAAQYLLAKSSDLEVAECRVTGNVPLWLLRRHVFPPKVAARIDALGCRLRPNLFGGEVLIKAVKAG